MRSRISKIMKAVVLFAMASAIASPVHGQLGGRDVFHRDELLDLGVYRPADIFELMPSWSSWSIDGFTHRASASGKSNYTQERWALFVDGRRVERSLLGVIDLNMLPVSIQMIDSVEVFNVPTTISGQYVGDGAIHIHTHREVDGFDAGVNVYTGNEINDPGPFLYKDRSLSNIDRVGPDYGGFLQGGGGGFYATVTANYREHHATDSHISHRTRVLHDNNNHSPRKLLYTPSLRVGFNSESSQTDITVSRSTMQDIAFVPSYGAEIPMRQTIHSVSYNGSYSIGDAAKLMASVVATEDFAHGRDNFLAWDPNIKSDILRARAALGFTANNVLWSVGAGLDLFRVRPGNYTLISDQYRVYKAYATADLPRPDGTDQVTAEVGHVAGAILPKVALSIRRTHINASASFSRNSVYESHSLLYWMHMGYDAFSSLSANPSNFDDIKANTVATADLSINLLNDESVKLSAFGGFRYSQNDWATIQDFTFIPGPNRFQGDIRIVPDLGGSHVDIGLRGEHNGEGGFGHFVQGAVRTVTHGGDIFREIMREMPRYNLSYRVRYTALPGFTMAGMFNLHSATEWRSFYSTSREGTPFYGGPVVPTQMKLSLSARKTILDGRVYTSFKIDNVLNRSLQDWPAGEVRDMTFHIAVGAALKGRSTLRYSEDPFARPLF